MVEEAVLTPPAGQTNRGDRPLSLLVLASKPKGISPSQRFRLEQWAPRLERDHRIRLDFAPFESDRLAAILNKPGRTVEKAALVARDFLKRSSVLRDARRYDAIVIHREAALIGPAIYERLLARTGKPIIFDFDDLIWSHSQVTNNGIFSRLHFFGKTSTICRLATAVTAGNEFLAEYARRRNGKAFNKLANCRPRHTRPINWRFDCAGIAEVGLDLASSSRLRVATNTNLRAQTAINQIGRKETLW